MFNKFIEYDITSYICDFYFMVSIGQIIYCAGVIYIGGGLTEREPVRNVAKSGINTVDCYLHNTIPPKFYWIVNGSAERAIAVAVSVAAGAETVDAVDDCVADSNG